MPSETYASTPLTGEKERERCANDVQRASASTRTPLAVGFLKKSTRSAGARDSTAFRILQPSEERARLPTALRRSPVGKQK
jgi:hypothetical protein